MKPATHRQPAKTTAAWLAIPAHVGDQCHCGERRAMEETMTQEHHRLRDAGALSGNILHCDWRELAERVKASVGHVDLLIVDAPYSERTHAGHDAGAASANRPVKANGVRDTGRERRSINYAAWTDDEVCAFVDTWSPLVRGWIVSITDDVLAPSWRGAYEANGRLGFAPLPFVETGATVRLTGDGPSNWTTWQSVGTPLGFDPVSSVVVGRPRTSEMAKWGTLPGWYSVPSERKPVVGGKPLAGALRLIEDYSRPGDIVCDPCCGGGTFPLAAKMLGRSFVAGDISEEHCEIARERLRDLPTRDKAGTLSLPWDGVSK